MTTSITHEAVDKTWLETNAHVQEWQWTMKVVKWIHHRTMEIRLTYFANLFKKKILTQLFWQLCLTLIRWNSRDVDWERSERSRSTAIQDGMQQWTCTHGSCIPLPRLIQSHWRPSIARALVVVILVTAVTYGGHPSAHFGDVETPWAESDRSSDVLHLQCPVVRVQYHPNLWQGLRVLQKYPINWINDQFDDVLN